MPAFNGAVNRETPDFIVALVGPGKRLQPYVDILTNPQISQHMPWLKLAAACVCDGHQPDWNGLTKPDVYEDSGRMREEHPELQLIVSIQEAETEEEECPGEEEYTCKAPCLTDGAANFFLELLRDTVHSKACATDLIHANTLFRTILEEMEEDVILLDTKGIIVDMNCNVYERKGLRREDILGLSCWEVEGADFCCETLEGRCPFRTTLRTGKKAEEIHSYVDDSGRMRYYRVYTYPVFDTARQLTHIMEIRRDITNRTNMELRLQQSEKMAAIGELATYIAHEIRNPLFAIGGFANSLLRSSSLDDNAREKASIILQESKRLDGILKSILNFARPTDARQTVVDINRIVADTMDIMGIGCKDKGIEIRLELGKNIANVKGDGEMLKQCLINMIKNAIEAMPDGGVLALRTSMTTSHVRLEIMDTGRGIPPELRDKVFNPFFSTKEQGAGLGLPMTKKIIEEMGGMVEIHSKSGEGTRVVVDLLPVLAVDERDQDLSMPLEF